MKAFQFFYLFGITGFLCGQLSAQKLYGCVYEQNSGQKIVPGVTIKPTRGNAITSGSDGHFTLFFAEMRPGMPVQMNASKPGWIVVDPSDLDAVLPLENISYLHKITMRREADANKEIVATTRILSNFMAKKNDKLANKVDQNSRLLEELITQQKQKAAEQAKAITSVNQDLVSDSERIAYQLVLKDSIEKAKQVREQLQSEKNFELALDAALAGDSRSLEIHRRNLVEQSRLALLEFDFDKADSTLRFLAIHDSSEFKSVYEYASFLQQQMQYDTAIKYYAKAAAVARTVFERIRAWNNLGDLYRITNAYQPAEQILKQALDSSNVLIDSNLVISEAYRAITLNTLGRLYKAREKYAAAENAFLTVLSIRKKQVPEDPMLFRPQLAAIFLNLGSLYNDNGNYDRAEDNYNRSLSIYKELADSAPTAYNQQIAALHNNLGILQTGQKNFGSAKDHLNRALSISRRLADTTHLTYQPYVAETLLNLGDLYRKTKDYPLAEQYYQESLQKRQQISLNNTAAGAINKLVAVQLRIGQLRMDEKDNPGATSYLQDARQSQLKLAETTPITLYGPQLAEIDYSLGELYRQQKDAADAEKMYQDALDLYKQMADSGYNNDFKKALLHLSLGILYNDQKNYPGADLNLQLSYDINKRLAADTTAAFTEDPANNQLLAADQRGLTLYLQERYDAAVQMQLEAIGIAKQLSQKNPGLYEDNIANLQINLGNTYFKKKDYPAAQQAYWIAATTFQKLKTSKPSVYGNDFCKALFYLGRLESKYKTALNRPVYEKMLAEALALDPTLTNETLRKQLKEIQQATPAESQPNEKKETP